MYVQEFKTGFIIRSQVRPGVRTKEKSELPWAIKNSINSSQTCAMFDLKN